MNLTEQIMDLQALKEAAAQDEKNGKTPKISSKAFGIYESVARNLAGDYSKGRVSLREALTTTDAVKLIPNIIEGQLSEA